MKQNTATLTKLRIWGFFVALSGVIGLTYQNCSSANFAQTTTQPTQLGATGQPVTPPVFKPSINDVPALVGWYTYTPNTSSANTTANPPAPNVDFTTQTGAFSDCPVLQTVDAIPGSHGQKTEYCYEPSGANGMYFGNANNAFGTLTSYILKHSSGATVVPTLATLFSNPVYQYSSNAKFKQGLFYYAMSYLWIPKAQDVSDPNWDVTFSVASVDDGMQIVANGAIVGNAYLQQPASFSLNKGQKNDGLHLNPGANTLAALWVDDDAVARNISGDKISYSVDNQKTTVVLGALPPNVLRGYIYSVANGKVIQGATVYIAGFGSPVTTDASGFFMITKVPDGTYQVNASYNGASYTESVVFDHTHAETAIPDFTRGL